jgi:subtilisin family serine protease
MKLRFGKEDWLELEPVPLESHVERGVRTFALAGPMRAKSMVARAATSRAAVVANRVTTQTFEKAASPFASPAELASAGIDKVETAVFRDRAGALRVVYREVVIRFQPRLPRTQQKVLLDKFGLTVRDRNSFHDDQIVAFDPKRKYVAERMVDLANELTETEEVVFAFPNFVSEFKRGLQAPQPVAAQWHLSVVEARKAWGTTQGKGIVVAVLDDGVDVDHPNLKGNIKRKPDPDEPRDLLGRDFFVGEDAPDHFDPRPKRFRSPFDQMPGNDIHGTCCAGVVAASGTGGVFGVAPKASLLPVKIFHADDLATESRVANAIRYASRFADILSCSWSGPASPDIEFALQEAGAGRGGKGCAVFCATGNETSPVGFPARSTSSIGVGASTDAEKLAGYSNRGPQVSVVAPSSGGAKGIFTTDVSVASRGFNIGTTAAGGADGLSTNSFGGTSSATPLTAGIAALVLAANPQLSRDELRVTLEQTAEKIGPANSYDQRGHSNDFGFGRVNAAKAVAQALTAAGAAKLAGAPVAKKAAKKNKAAKKKAAKKQAARKKIPAKRKAKAVKKSAGAAKRKGGR